MLQKGDFEDDIAAYIAERLPHAEMKVLFDVGANIGWSTTQFLKAYADCECYLFEPVSSNFNEIRATLGRFPETHPFPRTKCFRVGMGVVAERSRVTAVPGVTVNKIVGDRPSLEPVEEVDIITGDAFCAEHGIDRISFLKIDTEGYDLKVLLGFAGMLSQKRVDFVQVRAGMTPGSEIDVPVAAFEAILNNFGYRLFRYTNQASLAVAILTSADVVFMNEETAHALAAKSQLMSPAKAAAVQPDSSLRAEFEARAAAARQASDGQDWARALELWSQIITDFPDEPAGFAGKAAVFRELGQVDDADALLSTASRRFQQDVLVAADYAGIAMRRRDWDGALRRWEAVQRRFPNSPVGYAGKGEVLRELGRLDDAEAVLDYASREFPNHVWVATHHAAIASSRRDWTTASQRWHDLKTRFPDHWPAYTGLAEALRESGEIEQADRLLAEANGRFSNNEWVAIAWARAAMERQDWDEALRRWGAVLERFPDNALAHAGRAETRTAASAKDGSGERQRPRLKSRRFSTGDTKLSAYLSIYNDWDILEPALRSIKPFVDELVVVDGGYKWMSGFLDATGRDPERSDPRVYQALETAGIPFRVISRVWENEIEKRLAGYMACKHRFIYRVDADEILHFDENLEAFLRAGGAVAGTEIPLYLAPGSIIGRKNDPELERLCFLFDSKRVSAEAHLTYLWLILATEQLPNVTDRPPVFPAPVAFTAHLSLWRTPLTSINRATFYALTHIRAKGAPWAELGDGPLPDLSPLFERVPPKAFLDSLLSSINTLGCPLVGNNFMLKPSPLEKADEAELSPIYDQFMEGLARSNEVFASEGRYIIDELKLDMSSDAALRPLLGNSDLTLQFSSNLADAEVYLDCILPAEPWALRKPVEFTIEKNRLVLNGLPESIRTDGWLRRVLGMNVSFEDGRRLQRVSCV